MSFRLLVMRGGALGDFVLGLPALAALRDRYPEAELELVAPAVVLPLAAPLVDVATSLERAEIAPLFGESPSLPDWIVERYGGLDLAVLWLADGEGNVQRHFQALGATELLHAPALPPPEGRVHAADYLVSTLRPLGIDSYASPAIPAVRPGPGAAENARELRARLGIDPNRPLVALHPGSGGRRKCWPAQGFAWVAGRLEALGTQVVLVQGPADEEPVEGVLATIEGARPPVLAGSSVEGLAAFLKGCSGYLGNDSGVTHLAAATGTPTVAIFGPTDPAVWGPRGRRVVILGGRGAADRPARDGGPGSAAAGIEWPAEEEALEAVLRLSVDPGP